MPLFYLHQIFSLYLGNSHFRSLGARFAAGGCLFREVVVGEEALNVVVEGSKVEAPPTSIGGNPSKDPPRDQLATTLESPPVAGLKKPDSAEFREDQP